LPLADWGDVSVDFEVDVMIGVDYVNKFLLDHAVWGEQPCSPVAILPIFRFVLSGPIQIPALNTCSSNVTVALVLKISAIVQDANNEIHNELRQFWEFENLGMMNETTAVEVDELIKDKINFDGEHYQVTLPVKHQQTIIPDNYILVKKHLNSLVSRLKQKPEVFDQCNNVIKEKITSGIVERVSENEVYTRISHYILHSGVSKEDHKSTKLRAVYDASSKDAGSSA